MALVDIPPGLYRGSVEGVESGRCQARIEVRRIPGGCLSIDYEAFGSEGLQHVEHTVVSAGRLFVTMSEGPGVLEFRESGPGVFEGPDDGPYTLRLVAGWDGHELTWAWHWAERGRPPEEKSVASARLT